MSNSNLTVAKRARADELFTSRFDVENELKHYAEHFNGRNIYLPCDDTETSQFWAHLVDNFKEFKIRRLVATNYSETERVFASVCEMGETGELEISRYQLLGNGDMFNQECLDLMRWADIVVTNPPFSKFRQLYAELIEKGGKFLLLGNLNAVTYKVVFPTLKDGKAWLGLNSGGMKFVMPDEYKAKGATKQNEFGQKVATLSNTCWFTNLTADKPKEPLTLTAKYDPSKYQKYDNYDAINVDKVADIPCDYFGEMGVPITIMLRYCPEQFEIVNANDCRRDNEIPVKQHGLIKDKEATITEERERRTTYARILIRRVASPGSDGWHINGKRKYARIFIRRLPPQEATAGISTANENMPAYSSAAYLDMVARPEIDGKKVYRRVFIRRSRQ